MTDPTDILIMRLFETPDQRSVAIDLRTVSGIVQEGDRIVRIIFGKNNILVQDRFDRVWELVDKVKMREASN